jgi:hypothetical protein
VQKFTPTSSTVSTTTSTVNKTTQIKPTVTTADAAIKTGKI